MTAHYHPFRHRKCCAVWLPKLLFLIITVSFPAHSATDSPSAPQLSKLGSTGEELDVKAQRWSCVADKRTGLVWEKRDPTTALHGHDTFVWYQPEQTDSGAGRAHPDEAWADSTCYGFNPNDPSTFCNTNAYADRVNQSHYCGYNDWRLPTAKELLSLVDPTRKKKNLSPLIDTEFFPFHDPFLFWTNTVSDEGIVLTVFADDRVMANSERSDSISVRLVRGTINNTIEADYQED